MEPQNEHGWLSRNQAIRRLLIKPASCNPRVVSRISSMNRLLCSIFAITHLRNITNRPGSGQLMLIEGQQILSHFLEHFQLILVDVGTLILAESEQ
jgi:hypothetical protein